MKLLKKLKNKLGDLVDLGGAILQVGTGAVTATAQAAVGDFAAALDTAEETYTETIDTLQDALYVEQHTMEAIQTAIAMIVLQGVWIETLGATVNTLQGQLTNELSKVTDTLKPITDQIKEETDRARGIIDVAGVQTAMRALRDMNQAALIISPAYRNQVEGLYRETRSVSRRVFGDASTIHSGLSLFQMMHYDQARLSGQDPRKSQSEFIGDAIKITEMVSQRSERYARNPEGFWYDLQMEFLNPAQEAAYQETLKQNGLLHTLRTDVDAASGLVNTVQKRYEDYRANVDPFLSSRNLTWLDRTARTFELDYARPLQNLRRLVDEKIPEIDLSLAKTAEDVAALDGRLEDAEIATRSPAKASQAELAAQRERIVSILDHSLVIPREPPQTRFEQQRLRIDTIIAHLGEGK